MSQTREIQEQMRHEITDFNMCGKGYKAIVKPFEVQQTTVRVARKHDKKPLVMCLVLSRVLLETWILAQFQTSRSDFTQQLTCV